MNDTRQQLWNQLHANGLTAGELPAITAIHSPWYVRAMLGFSGWIAALFLLGFIVAGLEFIVDSEMASAVSGTLMLAIAYSLFRSSKSDFHEQFGLAVSFAGQALIAFALFEMLGWGARELWWLIAALQGFIAIVMPNFVQRLVAAYLCAHTVSIVLTMHGAPYITSALVILAITTIWINEFRWGAWGETLRAIGYGLVLALIQLKGHDTLAVDLYRLMDTDGDLIYYIPTWLGQSASGMLLVGVSAFLLIRNGVSWGSLPMVIGLSSALFIALVSFQAPGVSIGFIILLLGFSNRNRILISLGIIALLFYISFYYYLLETTLLTKSGILAATGITLLAIRSAVLRWVLPIKEKPDA